MGLDAWVAAFEPAEAWGGDTPRDAVILDPVYGDFFEVPEDEYGDDIDEKDEEGNDLWTLVSENVPMNIYLDRRYVSADEGDKNNYSENRWLADIPAATQVSYGGVLRLRGVDATLYNVEGIAVEAGSFFGIKTIRLSSNV